MAEKFRAALTRREVAVRDFFDLDHAITALGLNPEATDLIDMVRQKVTIPACDPILVGQERLMTLSAQVDTRLGPVLRPQDFQRFDLHRAFDAVARMAIAIK